jgi:hypothetical protein
LNVKENEKKKMLRKDEEKMRTEGKIEKNENIFLSCRISFFIYLDIVNKAESIESRVQQNKT